MPFALCDCNNFYASCERVFRPDLARRPVAVLSNNDGCVIARSAEVKAMGVKMGAPFFKEQGRLASAQTAVFSSNYALYDDMSRRVMQTLYTFAPDVEVYSIDEAFILMDTAPLGNTSAHGFCRNVREQVLRWTGIPVSLGVGPTKTLAKAANQVAKKDPSAKGVFVMPAADKANQVLAGVDVGDVWGVGKKYARMLLRYGVNTALDLKHAKDDWVKKHMTICGLRTAWELRGQVCHPFKTRPAPRKNIMASQSFGEPVTSLAHLREAVASFADRAAQTLRQQNSTAQSITTFITTSPFRAEPQYCKSVSKKLVVPTNYAPLLVAAALECLQHIYVPGLLYAKAGVYMSDLSPADIRQNSLFTQMDTAKHTRLMNAVDSINRELGKSGITLAASGLNARKPWMMKQARRSPRYTTRWEDLPTVSLKTTENKAPCRT